ncbi:MAG: sigma-54 interaction domain-containing protein [Pseudomonadota bacterium]
MALHTTTEHPDFQGRSAVMQTVFHQIDRAAQSDAPVLITGETGTGKELCAHAIHKQSRRAAGAFIALNCAAIPAELLESEVFGHNQGAFTGAVSKRDGAAVLANDGTFFLDEIGELHPRLQAKLLRFLQTGHVQRIGSNTVVETNSRIICATNRTPWEEVAAGRMREDLYYRLHVVPIDMPPLRQRGQDMIILADYFLQRFNITENKNFTGFDTAAQEAIMNYPWPGNVRQLENIIRHAVIMYDGPLLTADMLALPPARFDDRQKDSQISTPHQVFANVSQIKPLAQAEREFINAAIDQCDGNIPKAAAHLQISPSTIYRKIQAWEKPRNKLT